MIALDEPLPEPSRRVRVDTPGSAESKAAPWHELDAGGGQACRCPRTPRPNSPRRAPEQPLTVGDSNSRRRCQEVRSCNIMSANLLTYYYCLSPLGWCLH